MPHFLLISSRNPNSAAFYRYLSVSVFVTIKALMKDVVILPSLSRNPILNTSIFFMYFVVDRQLKAKRLQ
jgi:hypothetical protein